MATIVSTLPQSNISIKTITLRELIEVLPEQLQYDYNVWISGRLARDGKTSDNLIFIIEQDTEPTSEVMQYFSSLVFSLGISATASENWRNRKEFLVRLYNSGKLIINKIDLTYTEPPSAIKSLSELTQEYVRSKLPAIIPFLDTLWLTGSIVKNGYSCNDLDIMVGEPILENDLVIGFPNLESEKLSIIRDYFANLLGWQVHVGTKIMKEREPIYLYKIYGNGSVI